MNRKRNLAPLHPGEILREEFMIPMALSIDGVARAIGVPSSHIADVVNEGCGVSATMALELSRYFGTSAEMWLGLQRDFELETASDRV